ncbi:TPA: hypothetical protein J1216_004460 [Escherichia coli]|uniref:hypothetical protein n=1 Tax=Escherichia TaxID=561 RepID=UPI001070C854|nr:MULTISPECIES: hypothetical protein [Escherichia]EEZ6653229.1 hypothetical protein [Escherichia coli]EEZ8959862.1 hypothetical protein [Escherichia coli]EFE9463655.1 hypothetical protein [Escherichia coli]EFH6906549.1 hypothetical protein [Escherichia coli]EFH8236310.1 hypothetical protein [Escherichia coli]
MNMFLKRILCSLLPDPQASDSENEDNLQPLRGISENITYTEEENPYSNLLSLPNVRTLFWHEDSQTK